MNQKLGVLGVIFFGFAASAVLVVLQLQKQGSPSAALPPAHANAPAPQPTPKPNEVYNSDGSLKLTLKSANVNGTTDYVVYVSKGDGSGEKVLFNKTLPAGATLAIPGNSWSPDYKEVFLILKDGSMTQYLSFRADGEVYAQGDKYLEVTSLFTKANSKLTLRDVTGWDGYGLLHVETTNPDGSRGPRFWFVTGTRAFIQLVPAPNE